MRGSCRLSKSITAQPEEIRQFMQRYSIDQEMASSEGIYYISDCLIDFAVLLTAEQFYPFINLALEHIPQHHYFFERQRKWCLVITMSNFVDFGFAKEKKSRFSYQKNRRKDHAGK